MQKIVPFLWFNDNAEEAMDFYVSVFGDAKILRVSRLPEGTPGSAGKVITGSILLEGQEFMVLNGGPQFAFNPSISFLVACQTKDEVDALWAKLAEGGTALMELGTYPFSERYGWTADRYGVTWQIMYMGDIPSQQKITPTLMYVGDQAGRAEEAITRYTSVFGGTVGNIMRYGEDAAPDVSGTITHAAFTLAGQAFAAMDSAHKHAFAFSEAISLFVRCETQAEVDALWTGLAADPDAGQCGWLKDPYGVSWQIVPDALMRLMGDKDPAKAGRVMQAMLLMKKLDIAALEKAAEG